MMNKIIAILLNILLGIAFLLSAISKIPTIEKLGWIIAETNWVGWQSAEILACLLVGLEFVMGIFYLSQIGTKKTLPLISTIVLVLFSAYLLYVLKKYGNDIDCGCYGEWIKFTPTQSLIKNAVLLFLVFLTYFLKFEIHFPYQKILLPIIIALLVSIPFIKQTPSLFYLFENKIKKPIPFAIDTLRTYPECKDLPEKFIIAFVSPSCKYCKKAATRMRIMKERHPDLPFILAFGKGSEKFPAFFEETKASNIPYFSIKSKEHFLLLSEKESVPTIRWIEKDKVVKESNYFSLNEKEILKWLKE